MYFVRTYNYISYLGRGGAGMSASSLPGKPFPWPIILSGDIDGRERWGGTREPRDG